MSKGLYETPKYTIHSILASCRIAKSIPIQKIRARSVSSELADSSSMHRISFRVGPRQRYVTLFGNGTATIRGCRSIPEARTLLGKIRREVAPFAKRPKGKLPILVQNIVAVANLGMPLNLLKLQEGLGSYDISYEPEQFPGMILRPDGGKVVVLVFSSGQLVIVGSRSEDQLAAVLSEVCPLLDGREDPPTRFQGVRLDHLRE